VTEKPPGAYVAQPRGRIASFSVTLARLPRRVPRLRSPASGQTRAGMKEEAAARGIAVKPRG
jgi:hypothetical protein